MFKITLARPFSAGKATGTVAIIIHCALPIQSNPIEHQSFDCRTQSNIIELTIKFCQSNTIERLITERLVIEPNRAFEYRTIGIIESSINERRIA